MRRALVVIGMVAATAGSAYAQRSFAYEAGVFAEYTKFADTTHLANGGGGGARFGVFVLPRISLEYEGQGTPTSSPAQSGLQAWNNRVDAIYNWPLSQKTHLLVGAGWTGSVYKGDKTGQAYDQGFNVIVGIRQCMSERWAWRLEGLGDFKNPSDQTPGAAAPTQTYTGSLGLSWFIGG